MKSSFIVFITCFLIFAVIASVYYKMLPMVSVVMPTYNRADMLPRAIESILSQTYTDFEFIIVDDGSGDNTPEILNQYMKQDHRIRVIRNKQNCGVACSRNVGQQAARGKYIAIMDDDDISMPERLALETDYLEKNPDITVVVGNKLNMNTNKVWYRPRIPDEILFHLHFNNAVGNPEAMIRRDFIIKHHIRYNETYVAAEDYDYWKQVIFAGGKIRRIRDVVIKVRVHKSNSSEYYNQMKETASNISQEFLDRYGMKTFNPYSADLCPNLKEMIKNNKKEEIISNTYLKKIYDKKCQ